MWNKDRSIALSKCCVVFFALLLVLFDVWCVWGIKNPGEFDVLVLSDILFLSVCAYIASAFLFIILWNLWQLLGKIGGGNVFVESNVRYMRIVSWFCIAVALISASCAVYMYSRYIIFWLFVVITMAAGFMGLIVRIVKNCFQQAVAMKSELDFTI